MDPMEAKEYMESITKAAELTFWGYLGCELSDIQENEVVIVLDPKAHHLNLMGIVHGGVLSSLMDNAMGIAVMVRRPQTSSVTSNLNVHFVKPAKQGRLTVTAKIVHETGRSLTTESRIVDENHHLVALSTASFRII